MKNDKIDAVAFSGIIEEDFETLKSMLDRIHEKTKTHLNKVEVIQYYMPIKQMIVEAFLDITQNGIAFTEHESE